MIKFKKLGIAISLLSMITLSITGCGSNNAKEVSQKSSKSNENYEIKLGYYNCDHMVSACVGKDAGIYEKLGLNVKVTGNGKVPQAMAAEQMDAGYIGFTGLNIARVKGSPIIVGANNHEGGSYYLVVSNDIKNPKKDLVGQPMGIGSKPEETNSCWEIMANDAGIPVKGQNYKGINFDSDQSKYLALKAGKIKGYVCCDPWGSMAEYEGTGKILSTYTKPNDKDGVCCVFSLNKKFAQKHPDLAKKLVKAHTESIEYVYTHPAKAAKIFAENYDVPEEVALMTIYKKTVKEGRSLTWKVERDKFENQMEFERSRGFYTKKDNTYEDAVITKYLDECGADDFDKFIKEKVDPVFPVGMSYDEWKDKAYSKNK